MTLQIAVGLVLDIFVTDDHWQCWCIADILEVKDNKFQYELYGWGSEYGRHWMDKQNVDKYAPLHTHTAKCIRFKTPPRIGHNCGCPIYYYSKQDKKPYLIITSDNADYVQCDPYIYKFDIANNEYIQFAKYPDTLKPEGHNNVLDEKHDLLYLVGCGKVFVSLNLETAEWNIIIDQVTNTLNNDKLNVDFNDIWFALFDSINNELYLFDNLKRHYKYDSDKNKLIKCTNYNILDFYIEHGELEFIPFKQTFMIFGGITIHENDDENDEDHNQIFICNMNKDNDTNTFKWRLYDDGNTLLKHKTIRFYLIQAFQTLVFIFYYFFNDQNREIWILNLRDNKWFLSHIKFPGIEIKSMINSYDNFVHFFNGSGGDDRYHFKISLLDLIPNQMYQYYKENRYDKLIDGYIKNVSQNIDLPLSLKILILSFYPIWFYND